MNRKATHVLKNALDHGSPIELFVVEYPNVIVLLVFSATTVTEDTWLWVFNKWITPIYKKLGEKSVLLIGPDGSVEWLTPDLAA